MVETKLAGIEYGLDHGGRPQVAVRVLVALDDGELFEVKAFLPNDPVERDPLGAVRRANLSLHRMALALAEHLRPTEA